MTESPADVLRRHRAVLLLLIQALEHGIATAESDFADKGWRRDEHHGQLFAALAKACAIEGHLRDAEDAGIIRLVRGSMESLRIELPNGDGIWVQRPVDGTIVHGTTIGLPRDASSTRESQFRRANAYQLAMNLPDGSGEGRLSSFVMLWDADEDLGLECRLVAPYAEGADDYYWVWDFNAISLLELEPALPEVADADHVLDRDHVDGDAGGDLDFGATE